jgi:AcrR family transcriptional regulator
VTSRAVTTGKKERAASARETTVRETAPRETTARETTVRETAPRETAPRETTAPRATDAPLTRERILEAAEDVLRRYGPAKATVVDVARVLGVSHGSVYRHFPSKAALRDAVTEQWLDRIMPPLTAIVAEDAPAVGRLRRWFETLMAAKRRRASGDPELWATFLALATESRDVAERHVAHLQQQLRDIIADGVARGEFTVSDPSAAGRAVLDATARFHKPPHAPEWTDPAIDDAFEGVWSLILGGLGARSASAPRRAGAQPAAPRPAAAAPRHAKPKTTKRHR